jgi:hypothetical protein
MITYTDIHAQVDTAVKANGAELAEGIDIDAITAEIIDTYGLVDIDATSEDGDPVIEHDVFWAIVAKHDATQQPAKPYVDMLSTDRALWLSELRANGHRLAVVGNAVELTDEALAVLAGLRTIDDGHFDGTYIWIGGSEFAVVRGGGFTVSFL